MKDKNGQWCDVVLGYDTLSEYENRAGYFGACIGRVGNRIGNAEFALNGVRYELVKNDGKNHLHGGKYGFDKCLWNATAGEDFVRFYRVSPDGEEGYPGTLAVSVTYRVVGSALEITYDGVSNKDTLCSLTNHSYWNLNGGGSIRKHILQINAGSFLENDKGCLPTGKILPVDGTPFDFRQPKEIGKDIEADDINLKNCGGYDHNFCLNVTEPAAVLYSEESGIKMTVETTMPGVQVYSGNFIGACPGKAGQVYHTHDAVCLETQYYPNAMACDGFQKPILRAGATYNHVTKYIFSVD